MFAELKLVQQDGDRLARPGLVGDLVGGLDLVGALDDDGYGQADHGDERDQDEEGQSRGHAQAGEAPTQAG